MSTAERIRVMVVDDHPLMRNGLRDTLEAVGPLRGGGAGRETERRR